MLDFLGSILHVAGRFLGYILVINLFLLILKGGRETMRDLRDTTLMGIKVLIQKTQTWLFNKYEEQNKKPTEES